eukprot:6176428-Pleurochrysis_carterae.AAC.1
MDAVPMEHATLWLTLTYVGLDKSEARILDSDLEVLDRCENCAVVHKQRLMRRNVATNLRIVKKPYRSNSLCTASLD